MNALVNVHTAIDDQTLMTKSGDLITLLSAKVPDYECLDRRELNQVSRGFESAVRSFGENIRFYQYLIKSDNPTIPALTYQNPIVQEAVASRINYLKHKATSLYSLEIYFAIVHECGKQNRNLRETLSAVLKAPVANLREMLSTQQKITLLEEDLDRAREILSQKVTSFIIQLPEGIRATVLDKQRAFRFFRRLLNYSPHKADVPLKYDSFVDFQACDSALECHRDHLRLDDYYVQVMTVKDPPSQTFAHLLRGIQHIPSNFIVSSEWKRESNFQMLRRIRSMRRHFHNKKSALTGYLTSGGGTAQPDMLIDDSAVAIIADLGACLEEIELKGNVFGEFAMTVVLYGEDRVALKRSAADVFKVFATHGAHLVEERYNQLNAWLAVLPGNSAYNLRKLWLLQANYADLSFLFTVRTGEIQNAHLGTEYLAVLETAHGSPFFFNLHYQDVAHSAIFGPPGTGKSFFLNFILTYLQKYDPLMFIFDLGGSYENLTRLFNGSYFPVGVEKCSFTINPFALPPTPENLHFLFNFLKVLIESDNFRLTAQDERDLYQQIANLYILEPEQRRLLTLANVLGRNLRLQLQKWVDGGPYAAVFDNVSDNLTFARFQTFDFEGMDKAPQVLEPLLFYILHRANAIICDPARTTTFKAFVIDEAWRFLRHPTIKLYILEALKTWRKKNAGMILATQSNDDLLRSEMLPVVIENCPTKMFLANPDMDAKTYREIFHLNETEADLIAKLIPKQQILVKRPDLAKVLNLHVSPKDYWLYTSNPHDRERRRQAFEQYGFKKGLEILERSTE